MMNESLQDLARGWLGEGPRLLKYLPDLSQRLGAGNQNQGKFLALTASLASRDSDEYVEFQIPLEIGGSQNLDFVLIKLSD